MIKYNLVSQTTKKNIKMIDKNKIKFHIKTHALTIKDYSFTKIIYNNL